jgi:hypothetical protein
MTNEVALLKIQIILMQEGMDKEKAERIAPALLEIMETPYTITTPLPYYPIVCPAPCPPPYHQQPYYTTYAGSTESANNAPDARTTYNVD